ncbi:unnamed protein product, partial [Laminaria digitata]
RNVAIVFGVSTMIIAVTLGMVVNILWPDIALLSAADLDLETPSLLQTLSLWLLFGIFLLSVLRIGARAFVGEVTSNFRFKFGHNHDHEHSHDH